MIGMALGQTLEVVADTTLQISKLKRCAVRVEVVLNTASRTFCNATIRKTQQETMEEMAVNGTRQARKTSKHVEYTTMETLMQRICAVLVEVVSQNPYSWDNCGKDQQKAKFTKPNLSRQTKHNSYNEREGKYFKIWLAFSICDTLALLNQN